MFGSFSHKTTTARRGEEGPVSDKILLGAGLRYSLEDHSSSRNDDDCTTCSTAAALDTGGAADSVFRVVAVLGPPLQSSCGRWQPGPTDGSIGVCCCDYYTAVAIAHSNTDPTAVGAVGSAAARRRPQTPQEKAAKVWADGAQTASRITTSSNIRTVFRSSRITTRITTTFRSRITP